MLQAGLAPLGERSTALQAGVPAAIQASCVMHGSGSPCHLLKHWVHLPRSAAWLVIKAVYGSMLTDMPACSVVAPQTSPGLPELGVPQKAGSKQAVDARSAMRDGHVAVAAPPLPPLRVRPQFVAVMVSDHGSSPLSLQPEQLGAWLFSLPSQGGC